MRKSPQKIFQRHEFTPNPARHTNSPIQLRLRTGSSAATGWALNAWQTPMLQAAPLCPAALLAWPQGRLRRATSCGLIALLANSGSADSIPQSDTNGIAKWMLGLVVVAVPRSMIDIGTQRRHNACGKSQLNCSFAGLAYTACNVSLTLYMFRYSEPWALQGGSH